MKLIKAEVGVSPKTAENCMHVAERFGDKFVTVTNLSPGVLYTLAAPSTPDQIVERVLAGDIPPTMEAIREARRQLQENSTSQRNRGDRQAQAERADAGKSDTDDHQGEPSAVTPIATWGEAAAELLDLVQRLMDSNTTLGPWCDDEAAAQLAVGIEAEGGDCYGNDWPGVRRDMGAWLVQVGERLG